MGHRQLLTGSAPILATPCEPAANSIDSHLCMRPRAADLVRGEDVQHSIVFERSG